MFPMPSAIQKMAALKPKHVSIQRFHHHEKRLRLKTQNVAFKSPKILTLFSLAKISLIESLYINALRHSKIRSSNLKHTTILSFQHL